MPRRTLREARAIFTEDLAPALNPTVHAQVEGELRAAEDAARQFALGFLDTELAHVDAVRQDLLVEACAVRDGYEALRDRGAAGQLRAGEYARELADLDRRRRRVADGLAETERRVAELGAVEDDPLAWADDRYLATPTLRPTFSF